MVNPITKTTQTTTPNPSPNLSAWQRRPQVGWRNYLAKNFNFFHLASHHSWRMRFADGTCRLVQTSEVAGERPMPPDLHKGRVRVHAVFEDVDGGSILARGHVNNAHEASLIIQAVPIGISWAQVEQAAARYRKDLIAEAEADCRTQERAELRAELRTKRAALQSALKTQN